MDLIHLLSINSSTLMILLSTLQPNKDNPRTISKEQFQKLKTSLKKLPKMMQLRPIIIDKDGVIQGGNMRYKALIDLGYTEVPEEWVRLANDFTKKELNEFIIKDNVGFGEWDYEMLANEWEDIDLESWGVDLPTTIDSEDKDRKSVNLEKRYIIEISCMDEQQQEEFYNTLSLEGYLCKVITL